MDLRYTSLKLRGLSYSKFLSLLFFLPATFFLFAQPSNNNCGGAIPLTITTQCNPTAGITNGATQSQTGCTGTADDDVWYQINPSVPDFTITVVGGSGFDPVVELFSGTCGGSSLDCDNGGGAATTASITRTGMFTGIPYWIRVYHAGTGSGSGDFTICVHEPVVEPGCNPSNPQPTNQMTCDSVPKICEVNGFCGQTSGSYTPNHWPELNSAFCGSIENNSFVKFTANASTVQLRIWGQCSSGSGVQFMVFSLDTPPGTPGFQCNSGPITSYGCQYLNFNNMGSGGMALTFQGMTPGTDYYLMFDGFGGSVCDYKIGADFGVQLGVQVSPTTKSLCIGNSVQLVASGGDGNYTWTTSADISDYDSTDTETVNVTPSMLGTHEYIVTSTSNDPECPNTADTALLTVQTTPDPSAGIPDSICFGDTLELHGTPSDPSNILLWYFLAPTINPSPTVQFQPNFADPNPRVVVDQPGEYKFVFREKSQLCGQYYDTVDVLVIDPQQDLSAQSPSCAGRSDGIVTVSNPHGHIYSYDNGATWGPNPSLNTFAAGTYEICSETANGCVVCSPVIVPEGPVIGMDIGNDTTICENGTAELKAYGQGGIWFRYHWRHSTDTSYMQPVNPTVPGYYAVYAENQGGCVSDVDSIYVDILPPLELTTSLDTAVCPGEIICMSANGADGNGGPYNFEWSHGPSTVGALEDLQMYVPPSTGVYTVTLTDNCESTPVSANINVEVYPLPNPQFEVVEDSLCEPALFELKNTTNPNLTDTYTWILSDGQVYENLPDLITTPMDRGSYGVELTVISPNGCPNTTNIDNYLTAMTKPKSSFQFAPNPVTMFNTKVQFYNLSSGAEFYEWQIPGGTPSYSEEEDIETVYPDGVVENYPVDLIVYTDFGCSDTSQHIVDVLSEVIAYVPNTFTPNGDDYNNTWKVVLAGVEEPSIDIKVFNRWGEMVYHSTDPNEAWDGMYQGKSVPSGLYSYVITADDAISTEMHEWKGSLKILK